MSLPLLDEWEIPTNEVIYGKASLQSGKGAFSKVYIQRIVKCPIINSKVQPSA